MKKQNKTDSVMNGSVKILFIEDVKSDAEFIWREIAKNGIVYEKLLVDTRKDFLRGLNTFIPDIIVSDYSLPQFDGMVALQLRNEYAPQVPFIIVTGSVNEEVAVECMKAGADDYILKENLSRLGPAVINSINKIALLKQKAQAETALRESEERYFNLYNDAVIGLYRTNYSGKILMANRALIKMLGFQSFEELTKGNLNASGYGPSYSRQQFIDKIEKEDEVREVEATWIGKDGKEIFIKESARAISNAEGDMLYYDGTVEDITERKLAVDALLESRHLIEGILNAIPARVFWKDLNLIYLGCNEAFAHDAGFTDAKDMIGKSDYQMVWHDQADLYRNDDFEVIRSGNPKFLIEESQSTPEGKIITLLTSKVPLYNSVGEITGILGNYIDITDRKLAEEAVLKSEVRFRSYFNSSIVGIAITSPKKGWIEANEHLCEMLGYTLEELLQTTWSELTHPEDLEIDLDKFDRVLKGEIDGYHIDKRFICKNGEYLWTSLSVRCVRLANGLVDHFVALLFDISERRKAEDAVISERSLLRTLIDNLPAMIYVKDSYGRKVIANKQDVKNIGFDKEAKVIGKTDIELFSGMIGKRGYEDDKEVIQSGKAMVNREEFFIDKKGVKRWLLSSKIPLFDKVGKTTGLVGIGHDITERKNIEAELISAKERAEQSDKLKTAFLNNISHEIRTPLNAIVGFATLLGTSELPDANKKKFVDIINESNEQLLTIISGIISMASLESGQEHIKEMETDINQLMLNVYEQFLVSSVSAEVSYSYHPILPEARALVNTDPVKLMQILVNLVGNALKFTRKGIVRFGCTVSGNKLQFFVEDTGIGIPQEMQEIIFKQFMQLDNSPTRKYGGTGLGLSISKGYVELLGGSISLKSKPGKGSVFSFTLPYNPVISTRSDVTADRIISVKKITAGKTILVAEDETNNFLLINELLTRLKLQVIRVENGLEAVNLCTGGKLPDLILMDIKMPVMDGIEATKRIKEFNPGIPIIALTAYALANEKKYILDSGCDACLEKPIRFQALSDTLAKYLSD